jgi:hypothetical protein
LTATLDKAGNWLPFNPLGQRICHLTLLVSAVTPFHGQHAGIGDSPHKRFATLANHTDRLLLFI